MRFAPSASWRRRSACLSRTCWNWKHQSRFAVGISQLSALLHLHGPLFDIYDDVQKLMHAALAALHSQMFTPFVLLQVTSTDSTLTCLGCLSMAGSLRRRTTCSWATTSIVASRALKPSACCSLSRWGRFDAQCRGCRHSIPRLHF